MQAGISSDSKVLRTRSISPGDPSLRMVKWITSRPPGIFRRFLASSWQWRNESLRVAKIRSTSSEVTPPSSINRGSTTACSTVIPVA